MVWQVWLGVVCSVSVWFGVAWQAGQVLAQWAGGWQVMAGVVRCGAVGYDRSGCGTHKESGGVS